MSRVQAFMFREQQNTGKRISISVRMTISEQRRKDYKEVHVVHVPCVRCRVGRCQCT